MRYLGWSSMLLVLIATIVWADAPPTDAPAPSPSPEPVTTGGGGAMLALWDAVADASPDFWQGSDTAPDRLVLRYGTTRRVAALPPQYPAIERVLALLAQGE